MQDVDRIAHVQALPQPARGRGVRVQANPRRNMPSLESAHGIAADFWWKRHRGQELAIRAAEVKLPILLTLDLVALLVDGAMVSATHQGEVGERGGPAVGPVTDVMALAEAHAAAREAATTIAMVERPA